jgi:hypothetical protein
MGGPLSPKHSPKLHADVKKERRTKHFREFHQMEVSIRPATLVKLRDIALLAQEERCVKFALSSQPLVFDWPRRANILGCFKREHWSCRGAKN